MTLKTQITYTGMSSDVLDPTFRTSIESLAGMSTSITTPIYVTTVGRLPAPGINGVGLPTGGVQGDGVAKLSGTDYEFGIQKNNYIATSDPTVNNDSAEGYLFGSIWINTVSDEVFICQVASVGAANWINFGISLALTSHIANDGSDHSFIDQDVKTVATPEFDGIITGATGANVGNYAKFARVGVGGNFTTMNYHGFEDYSIIDPDSNPNLGYSNFDARATINGTVANDHFVGFQSRLQYNGGNITGYLESFNAQPTHNGVGTIAEVVGMHIHDVLGTGPITDNYGIYVENIARGSGLNYGIYQVGADNYFGGNSGFGESSPDSSIHSNGNIEVSAGAGFMNNVYFSGGWKYSGNGYGFSTYISGTDQVFKVFDNNTGGHGAPATEISAFTIDLATGEVTIPNLVGGGGGASYTHATGISNAIYAGPLKSFVIPAELDGKIIKEVRISADALPVGQSILVDVRKNSYVTTDSIFTGDVEINIDVSESNTNGVFQAGCGNPTLGTTVGTPGTTIDVAHETVAANDVINVYVTQVGSTFVGAGLNVEVVIG